MSFNLSSIIGIITVFLLVSCQGGKSTTFGGPDTEGISGGSEPVGDFGNLNDAIKSIPGLGSTEQQALVNTNDILGDQVPSSGIDELPPAIQQDVVALQQAQKQGKDTTQMRYALMSKMLASCAETVSKYAPSPGETFMGKWVFKCAETNVYSAWNLTGQYASQDEAGHPLGKPTLSHSGVLYGDANGTTVAGAGKGSVTADMSGNGQANGAWVGTYDGKSGAFNWMCPLTDQPKAATGSCKADIQTPGCSVAIGALVSSKNPIPEKYQEGVKKLGACLRQAIVYTSPILWKYMSSLNPNSQAALMQVLYLK